MGNLIKQLLLAVIRIYQRFISPILPARCRYYPTCSQYGIQAIQWHGTKRGGWLTIKRICNCHPFGGHGIDFVPLPIYSFKFRPSSKLYKNFVYIDQYNYNYQLNHWLKYH